MGEFDFEKQYERASARADAAEKRLRKLVGDAEIARLRCELAEARLKRGSWRADSKVQRQAARIKQLEKQVAELTKALIDSPAPTNPGANDE